MAKLIGILAVDSDYGIGNEGKLLPFDRSDMLHFQKTVRGHVILCTGSTYEQMNKKLGDFFVYTRKPVYYVTPQGACSSARYLLNKAIKFAKANNKDVYVCGGKRLYDLLKNEIKDWLITVDDAVYPSDCKVPWVKELLESNKNQVTLHATLAPMLNVWEVKVNDQVA